MVRRRKNRAISEIILFFQMPIPVTITTLTMFNNSNRMENQVNTFLFSLILFKLHYIRLDQIRSDQSRKTNRGKLYSVCVKYNLLLNPVLYIYLVRRSIALTIDAENNHPNYYGNFVYRAQFIKDPGKLINPSSKDK